jgi:hypothetical protein
MVNREGNYDMNEVCSNGALAANSSFAYHHAIRHHPAPRPHERESRLELVVDS